MLVGKGGYAILDLKHVGNSGTISGIYNYAKKLCESGKPIIVMNPYTPNRSYYGDTGYVDTYDSNKIKIPFTMSNLTKVVAIATNDTLVLSNESLNLNSLSDVNALSPSDGDVLKFDSATQKWVNGSGGSGIDFEVLDELEWTWDSTFKSWSAPLTSELVSALSTVDHEVYVQLELPMDNEETPETIYLGCMLFNGGGSKVSSSYYSGEGTPFITVGEYIFKVTVISDPEHPVLQVEPFTLSKPS